MVFTQLIAMAEDAMGEEAVDDILDDLDLPHGGVYTSVGLYPCSELVAIVDAVSRKTGQPVPALQHAFGLWLHAHFVKTHPGMYADKPSALHMLDSIEHEVHVEVRKLYQDVELPTFETEWDGPTRLLMTYRSTRHLKDFCRGLIDGCLAHYGATASIEEEDISTPEETVAVFDISVAA